MDFVNDFKRWVGKSECPPEYLEWAALSLLAAAAGNRIFIPYRIGYDDIEIYPNLYVILFGPSGNFKSFTINKVKKILKKVPDYDKRINLYSGHVTHSGMYDALRTVRRSKSRKTGAVSTTKMPWAGQFYLLQDELARDVGGLEMADQFIRALTGLYHGEAFDDHTRTHGHVHLEDFCINWFAASTLDWAITSISPNTIMSGFFGRIVAVNCGYSKERIAPFQQHRPTDWETNYSRLVGHIDAIMQSEGPIPLSEEAMEIDEKWYMSRERTTTDDFALQVIQRQHDLALKLSLLLTLSHSDISINKRTGQIEMDVTEISGEDLATAQDMTLRVLKWQKEILPSIRKGAHGTPQEKLLEIILSAEGWVPHTKIFKIAFDKYGMHSAHMEELLNTWQEAGLIECDNRPRSKGGSRYKKVQA
jgi:hypothetical protein